MQLTSKQTQHLRRLAHHLRPVVLIGNAGFTEAVMEEINIALTQHELIKVKINAGDRKDRKVIYDDITSQCQCHPVQLIGRTAMFYRQSEDKKISLPK